MTIQTLINKVQEEKPNTFGNAKLVSFINEVEADVADQVHITAPVYAPTDLTAELIVPSPYDRLYVSYLKAMIDYANEEYPSYQLNADQHGQDMRDFIDWIVRTRQITADHTPRRMHHIL